jgi:hypothetical protein
MIPGKVKGLNNNDILESALNVSQLFREFPALAQQILLLLFKLLQSSQVFFYRPIPNLLLSHIGFTF